MNSATDRKRRRLPSDTLLLVQIVAIPLMKPGLGGQVIAADLLFLVLVLAIGVEVLAGLRRPRWIRGFGALAVYIACLAPSLLATSDMRASLFKLATEFYLIGLAAVPALIIDSEAKFRRAILAWLAVTAVVCLDAVLSLFAFVTGTATWLFDYSSFGFGSLPAGDYPRLALTFFNANMACNYLTAGLALTFVARRLGYLSRLACSLLLVGIGIASLSTLSPGLGGVALLAGLWAWLTWRERAPKIATMALLLGVVLAALFTLALAITPFRHSTAPFSLHLAGALAVYPGPRWLTWTAAAKQFLNHPLIGAGIGIDPIHVGFASPTGYEVLTDAHNLFLSIAAQCGAVGLIGLAAIIVLAIRLTPSPGRVGRGSLPCFLLGTAFLDTFVYQGLGGSFEDTRHIWLLLGLLMAAARLDFTRADENNRTADAPSPC